ncbi:MAG: response regulator transcription factor [Magnetovibrio sp.]|nr:response regulator transcription factor [Magnetovibrio sp.]
MKIAIADDHALVREGLAAMLERTQSVSEVLEAGTLDELIDLLEAHHDVGLVPLDLNMPGMNDLATLEYLQDAYPTISFAILSATEVAAVARRFLEAGAAGYIPKSADNNVLLAALNLILSGNVYVPPFALKKAALANGQALNLTERQGDILTLMVQGSSNKSIAMALGLSESTVKTHISGVLKAFGVQNRTKAIYEAIRLGIVESP